MRHYSTWILTVMLITVLAQTGCKQKQQQDEEQSIRPVRYITMVAAGAEQSRTFSGSASSGKKSALSFKVAGTIKSIPVKVGDVVEVGTFLAEIDSTDFQVEYDAAVASLKTAEADAEAARTAVNTTRSNYGRIEKLYESGNVPLSEFEQARGEYETAQAQLQASMSRITTADTQLKAAKNRMDYTRLIAPFDGIVNTIVVDENEEITPGATVMTLSGFGSIEVTVNLSDLYITRVKKGMMAQVSFPAISGIVFDGMVTEVPYATSDAPTYPVTIQIDSDDQRLRPGMAASVIFSFGNEKTTDDSLFLPSDAVGEDGAGNFVYVIKPHDDGTGTVEKRVVVLGELAEQGFEVQDGLVVGELVATSGLQMLLDGMQVKLTDDPVKNW